MAHPPRRYIPHPEKGLLTNKEAAEIKGVSEATISRWTRDLKWEPEDFFINNREHPIKYVFGQKTIKLTSPDGFTGTLVDHAKRLGGSYTGMVMRYRNFKDKKITEEQLFAKFRKPNFRLKKINRKVDWQGNDSVEAGRYQLEEERQHRLRAIAKREGIKI